MSLKELTIFFPPRLLGGSLAVILVLGAISSHLSVNRLLHRIEP